MAFDLNMEEILDHYKHPHNFGKDEHATHEQHEANSLCGDDITVYLQIKDGVVDSASFEGHGCAISMASASMLTDNLRGMKVEDALKMSSDDVIKMLGIELTAVRVKCAVLCMVAVKNAIKGETNVDN